VTLNPFVHWRRKLRVGFQSRRQLFRAIECGCWRIMREQRAKLKSCKYDDTTAQGKRATSAALGCGPKTNSSLFSPGLARQSRRKKRGRVRVACYPGRRPSWPFPWLIFCCPSRAPGTYCRHPEPWLRRCVNENCRSTRLQLV